MYDSVPSAALLGMGVFAVGSNRGYDELVPHYVRYYSVFESSLSYKWINQIVKKLIENAVAIL